MYHTGCRYAPETELSRVIYGQHERTISSYDYDASGRMTAYTSVKQWGSATAKLIDGYLYAYDDFGNISHQVDHEGYVTAYRYDAANRLEQTWYPAQRADGVRAVRDELRALGVPTESEPRANTKLITTGIMHN